MASIKDILKSDPRGLTESQLRKEVQQLADAANKRAKRMQNADMWSPAEKGRERSGAGMFSTRGKNYNQLQAEFKRAKQYLESKTSTIAGAKEFRQNVLDATNERLGVNMSEKEADTFWKTMGKVYEQVPEMTMQQSGVTSYDAQKRVYEMMQQGVTDPVELAEMLTDAERMDIWKRMEEAETMGDWLESEGFFAT